jgi:hypothetical protein
MEWARGVVVSPSVPAVIESEIVTAIRELASRGWGRKTIARAIGVSINTVRRYVRQPLMAGVQVRPTARRLTEAGCREARALFVGPAEGNAVVVQRVLAERGVRISTRTVQRAVAAVRREQRAADLATVRVETAPGDHYGEPNLMERFGGDRGLPAGCTA